jgi:hypothetical protein
MIEPEVEDMLTRSVLACTLLLGAAAHDAAAQGFVAPFAGTTLTSPTAVGSGTKAGFGVAFGGLGKIVGGETEFAYYPEVLDNASNGIAKNKVFTISGSTLIGPTIGPVKVYGAIGLGDLHLNVTSLSSVVVPNPSTISNDYFTINAGGGVFGFFSAHVGVRGDLRFYRAFGFKISDVEGAGLALDKFDFWRAAGAVAFRF